MKKYFIAFVLIMCGFHLKAAQENSINDDYIIIDHPRDNFALADDYVNVQTPQQELEQICAELVHQVKETQGLYDQINALARNMHHAQIESENLNLTDEEAQRIIQYAFQDINNNLRARQYNYEFIIGGTRTGINAAWPAWKKNELQQAQQIFQQCKGKDVAVVEQYLNTIRQWSIATQEEFANAFQNEKKIKAVENYIHALQHHTTNVIDPLEMHAYRKEIIKARGTGFDHADSDRYAFKHAKPITMP